MQLAAVSAIATRKPAPPPSHRPAPSAKGAMPALRVSASSPTLAYHCAEGTRDRTDSAVHLPVPHRLQSVGCARDFSHAWLTAWGKEAELVSDVLLVVSELITNAVQHAAAPVSLTLRSFKGGAVGVTVTDGGAVSPVPQERDDPDERGRGCFLVEAVAQESGRARRPGGQIAWATLGPGVA